MVCPCVAASYIPLHDVPRTGNHPCGGGTSPSVCPPPESAIKPPEDEPHATCESHRRDFTFGTEQRTATRRGNLSAVGKRAPFRDATRTPFGGSRLLLRPPWAGRQTGHRWVEEAGDLLVLSLKRRGRPGRIRGFQNSYTPPKLTRLERFLGQIC